MKMNDLKRLNEIIEHLEKAQNELTMAVGKFQRDHFTLPIIHWNEYPKIIKMMMRQSDFIKRMKKYLNIMERRSGNKTN